MFQKKNVINISFEREPTTSLEQISPLWSKTNQNSINLRRKRVWSSCACSHHFLILITCKFYFRQKQYISDREHNTNFFERTGVMNVWPSVYTDNLIYSPSNVFQKLYDYIPKLFRVFFFGGGIHSLHRS